MNSPAVRNRSAMFASFVCVFALGFSGCDEEPVPTSKYSITEDEGAVILAHALGTRISTYGLAGQFEELAGISNGGSLAKELKVLDSIAVIRARAGDFSYFYVIAFAYGSGFDQFNAIYDMGGTYDTPTMASRDTLHAELTFTGVHAETVSVSGNHWRLGEQTSKLADMRTYRSEIISLLTNVTIDRITQTIVGGIITVTLIERFPDGFVRSLPGTITFLGRHRAQLQMTNKRFGINLDTLEITPL
jgi:hypothetical protein